MPTLKELGVTVEQLPGHRYGREYVITDAEALAKGELEPLEAAKPPGQQEDGGGRRQV